MEHEDKENEMSKIPTEDGGEPWCTSRKGIDAILRGDDMVEVKLNGPEFRVKRAGRTIVEDIDGDALPAKFTEAIAADESLLCSVTGRGDKFSLNHEFYDDNEDEERDVTVTVNVKHIAAARRAPTPLEIKVGSTDIEIRSDGSLRLDGCYASRDDAESLRDALIKVLGPGT